MKSKSASRAHVNPRKRKAQIPARAKRCQLRRIGNLMLKQLTGDDNSHRIVGEHEHGVAVEVLEGATAEDGELLPQPGPLVRPQNDRLTIGVSVGSRMRRSGDNLFLGVLGDLAASVGIH